MIGFIRRLFRRRRRRRLRLIDTQIESLVTDMDNGDFERFQRALAEILNRPGRPLVFPSEATPTSIARASNGPRMHSRPPCGAHRARCKARIPKKLKSSRTTDDWAKVDCPDCLHPY